MVILRRRALIDSAKLMLAPGPLEIPVPFYSTDQSEQVEYPIAQVADALDQLAARVGARSSAPAAWKWLWAAGAARIEVGFSAGPSSEGRRRRVWQGSPLIVKASPVELLDFWRRLRLLLPATWLHDEDCRVYRPEAFLEEWDRRGLGPRVLHLPAPAR